MIVQPIHTAEINGKPLRFFASPLTNEPDFPWHSMDDIAVCMGLNRGLRREFLRRLKQDRKADVRTVGTPSGITTICPHFMAQGFIDAMIEVGQCQRDFYMLYVKAGVAAMDAMTEHLSKAEAFAWSIDAARRVTGDDTEAKAIESAARWGSEPRTIDDLRERIAAHDIVIGVYPEGDSYASHLIKGESTLLSIIESRQTRNVGFAGVPCKCLEEAVAMRLELGDGKIPSRVH